MYYIFQKPKTINDLASICRTPRQLLIWMRVHIHHGGHDDSIQRPQSTLEKGVCSYLEFSWLFHDVLCKMGIDSYIVTVDGNSKSVACLFDDDNGKLKCMVNRWTMFKRYDNISNSIGYIDRDWFRWIEWAVLRERLVPVKPHYRDGYDGTKKDTRNYLLRNGLSSM